MNNVSSAIPLLPGNIESLLMFGFSILIAMIVLFIVVFIVPMCLIFRKAGRRWWEALIPIYNVYVLTVITGQPWWILFGFLIPVVNWIVGIYLYYHLSKRFGYDIPFTIGLVLLPFIFLPILGFGNALYTAPLATSQGEPVTSPTTSTTTSSTVSSEQTPPTV